MIARVGAGLVAVFSGFALAILGSALFLLVVSHLEALDNYFLYAWLAGVLSGALSLFLVGLVRPTRPLSWLLPLMILGLALPMFRIWNHADAFGRTLRYFVFFAHLPACAMFGVLVSALVYGKLREVQDA